MKNNYLYQGSYSEYDDDIGWNDFALRSYDAQVGRFWQSDPYDEFASGYTGMGNDPVNKVDPSGGSVVGNVLNVIKDVIPCPGSATALISSATSTMIATISSIITGMRWVISDLSYATTQISEQQLASAATQQVGEGDNDDEWEIYYKNGKAISSARVGNAGGDFMDVVSHIDIDKMPSADAVFRRENIFVKKYYENVPGAFPDLKGIGFRVIRKNIGPAPGTVNYVDAPGFIAFGLYGTTFRFAVAAKGVTSNPFKGKTFSQIDEMFKAKGFDVKVDYAIKGKGSYISPNGNRYWLDKGGMYKKGFEGPHVDIWYNGHPSFEKVKFFLDGSPKMYTPLKK